MVYKSESFYGDVIRCEVMPAEFTRAGFDLYYRLSHAEKMHDIAHAKTGMVCFDYQNRKVVPVPEAFIQLFK